MVLRLVSGTLPQIRIEAGTATATATEDDCGTCDQTLRRLEMAAKKSNAREIHARKDGIRMTATLENKMLFLCQEKAECIIVPAKNLREIRGLFSVLGFRVAGK